jgi:outer membrane receptor protein involved in Fe transport
LGEISPNRFGVEFGLFNRISVEADYYQKNTDGLLFSVPLAISSGASTINQNIGKLESSGFELTLNSNIVDSESFKWNTSFNITTNTVVKSMPNNNADIVSNFNINRVGENVSSFYLIEYAGVDPANGDALF